MEMSVFSRFASSGGAGGGTGCRAVLAVGVGRDRRYRIQLETKW